MMRVVFISLLCLSMVMARSQPQVISANCKYITRRGSVRKAKVGERYKDGCNNCRCTKNGGMCNKKACPKMCMYKHWSGTVGYAKAGGKKWLKVEGKDCRRKCKCVMGPKKGTKLKCTKRCYEKAKKDTGRRNKRNKRKSKRKGRRKKRRNRKRKKSKYGSPTTNPTTLPTVSPTTIPTNVPTSNPTVSPTILPTNIQTSNPTVSPSVSPTNIPTSNPTQKPTFLPTQYPTSSLQLLYLVKTNYANDWDKPLGFQAGRNRVITGFYSIHDNVKEDRRFAFYTMWTSGFSCVAPVPWPAFVNRYDGEFKYQCPDNRPMSGVYSVHYDKTEDRVFRFKCCYLSKGIRLQRMGWTSWQNDWDKKLDFRCNDGVITGVHSIHSNDYEDRRFAFQCSKLLN